MLNRLLGIIYILMNKGTVTALELSRRFEVSVRTIYRDVENLSMAGIPIYTKKGKNGGISLTDGFVLNKMLVTTEEQQQILAALCSLDEVGAMDEKETLKKLGDFFQIEPRNWVSIDMSDWSGYRQELVNQLKQAILYHRAVEFDYYGQYREMSRRTVEPVQLIFKEYTWYLSAYCRSRQAMRLFKVLRIKNLKETGQAFMPDGEKYRQDLQMPVKMGNSSVRMEVVLKIVASEAYRIYDRFEEYEIFRQEDGDFLVRTICTLDDWVYGMILSFGPAAEVLEPEPVREEMKNRLSSMLEHYM